jgi:hypothetical protein
MSSTLLDRFSPQLRVSPPNSRAFLLGSEMGRELFYIPFEEVNHQAKLVLVGITPVPTQMEVAYRAAGEALGSGYPHSVVLRKAKQLAAFDGMRPRINEMLDHFQIPQRLGLGNAASLWGSKFDLFQPTSIIPNAAFKSGKYFNGPFSDVLAARLFRDEFESGFVASLAQLSNSPFFVAMGPVVNAAIQWCIAAGKIDQEQYLGYLPHPSGNAGSQFSYFMRQKTLDQLKPKDPVRHRAADLDAAYERMSTRVQKLPSVLRANNSVRSFPSTPAA